ARSERLRMRELTQQGIRQTKFLRLYCTYTVAGAEETKTTDFVEKLMLQGQKTWHQFTGQIHAVRFQRIEIILKDSFHSGFLLWEQTLSNNISKPSSFRTDAKLLVFALRSLSSEADAAILALSAYAAALRRALSSKASIFFLDEAPILFQFEAISELIGRLCANGAKAGIRVILSAQEPDSIYQSKAAPKIFANLTTRLIGRIQTSAIEPFIKYFKSPPELISRNSTESFFPKKEGIYSQWLLDENSKFTFCRYYPAHCLLAAVANNPDEQELRTLYLNKYKDDPLTGLVRFSEIYVQMIKGEPLTGEAAGLLKAAQEQAKLKHLHKVA
ncbi:hypothetical protein ACE1CM_39065, partial [Microseira sp. BLCC-F43]